MGFIKGQGTKTTVFTNRPAPGLHIHNNKYRNVFYDNKCIQFTTKCTNYKCINLEIKKEKKKTTYLMYLGVCVDDGVYKTLELSYRLFVTPLTGD